MSGKKSKTQEKGVVKRPVRKCGKKATKPEKAEQNQTGDDIEATPPTTNRRQFPVFESIGQAAAVLGAPQALLKAAKRQGCRAFISGSRVDSGLLIPFLFGMMTKNKELPEGVASASDWLSMEKAKREAIKRATDEKQTMLVSEACRQASEACTFLFAELERMERELPPLLAGGTTVDIYTRMHQFVESLRKAGKEKFETIGK